MLGAVVTALIGTRQLFKLEQDWIRFSRTLIDLHAEFVLLTGQLAHCVGSTQNGTGCGTGRYGAARLWPGS